MKSWGTHAYSFGLPHLLPLWIWGHHGARSSPKLPERQSLHWCWLNMRVTTQDSVLLWELIGDFSISCHLCISPLGIVHRIANWPPCLSTDIFLLSKSWKDQPGHRLRSRTHGSIQCSATDYQQWGLFSAEPFGRFKRNIVCSFRSHIGWTF